MSQTIDDFRNFFKENKQKEKINLKKCYEKTFKIANAKYQTYKITVVKNIEDIEVETLENELIQVIINILNNAKDALLENCSKDDRFIFVDIYKNGNTPTIEIKDSAGGIPTDIIDKVFDPYFTTKGDNDGTGIGLYMSKQIVTKNLSGSLDVKNETFEYQGTTYTGANFTLKL
jgi:signal transduction histidine kinase